MKSGKITLFCLLLLGVLPLLNGQSSQYKQTMKTLKAELVVAETKEQFIALKNKYNRVAVVETAEWLPCYYETFCTLAWAFEEKDATLKQQLAAQVEAQLDALKSTPGHGGEVDVLRGRWLQLRSSLPTENFMQVGMEMYGVIPQITERYPQNPRGWILLGELIVNAPKGFMGYSQKDAQSAFQKAADLLDGVNELDHIQPTWGSEIVQGYLQRFGANSTPVSKAPAANPYELLDAFYDTPSRLSLEAATTAFGEKRAAHPKDYVWSYHYAFCLAKQAMSVADLTKVDGYCDLAEEALQAIPTSAPQDEVLCLKALITVTRIRVDYQKRGAKYYMESEGLLTKAMAANADNPRAYYLKGQNQYNLPAMLGGGAAAAKPYFEKCKTIAETTETNPNIRWGYQESVNLLVKI